MPPTGLFGLAAIVCAGLAAVIIIAYLFGRPPLNRGTKLRLALGLGVFPIGAALSTTVVGMHATSQAEFCGDCHNMTPFLNEATDAKATNIAAIHTRVHRLSEETCETCHADYTRFGPLKDKLAGMQHVWKYYTEYRSRPTFVEGGKPLEFPGHFQNATCMQCHTTTTQTFTDEPSHSVVLEDIRSGKASCVTGGCHGPAHPVANGKPALKEASR